MIRFLDYYGTGEKQQHFCDNSPCIDGLACAQNDSEFGMQKIVPQALN